MLTNYKIKLNVKIVIIISYILSFSGFIILLIYKLFIGKKYSIDKELFMLKFGVLPKYYSKILKFQKKKVFNINEYDKIIRIDITKNIVTTPTIDDELPPNVISKTIFDEDGEIVCKKVSKIIVKEKVIEEKIRPDYFSDDILQKINSNYFIDDDDKFIKRLTQDFNKEINKYFKYNNDISSIKQMFDNFRIFYKNYKIDEYNELKQKIKSAIRLKNAIFIIKDQIKKYFSNDKVQLKFFPICNLSDLSCTVTPLHMYIARYRLTQTIASEILTILISCLQQLSSNKNLRPLLIQYSKRIITSYCQLGYKELINNFYEKLKIKAQLTSSEQQEFNKLMDSELCKEITKEKLKTMMLEKCNK